MTYRKELIANIAWAVGVAVITNVIVFANGWNTGPNEARPSLAPPGYVIGIIWTVLFACMGAARFLVRSTRLAHWIVGLIAFCLAYPFYTSGLESNAIAMAGNLATIALAAWIALRARSISPRASALIGAVAAWVCYASAITLQSLAA